MPQMMPINWIFSFIIFILIFILFNILNFYIYYNKMSTNKKFLKSSNNMMYWKW
uniref:ATP synthase F0 subunit 8 n=1 Tax=Celaenorrhinus consanguineus TaxID=1663112 RepID=UPI0026E18B63|nr:ATP synthase F0 subunit 8 [Celaenorrhinus consanguineus]WJJ70307.1 ATP synthase F0 subunit 8 [Celaenorrhinus consanguineus]